MNKALNAYLLFLSDLHLRLRVLRLGLTALRLALLILHRVRLRVALSLFALFLGLPVFFVAALLTEKRRQGSIPAQI